MLEWYFVFQEFWISSDLVFYRGGKLSLEKLCQIENSKQANFSDFQQLAMTLQINSQI